MVRCGGCGLTYQGNGAVARIARHADPKHGQDTKLLITERSKSILGGWGDIVHREQSVAESIPVTVPAPLRSSHGTA